MNGQTGMHRRPTDSPGVIKSAARELLNTRRLPAMLTVAQTAVLLNRGEHDIPLLVRAGLLKPLGNPPPNAVKFFATVDVLELAGDRDSLHRICSVLTEHWRAKNRARAGKDAAHLERESEPKRN